MGGDEIKVKSLTFKSLEDKEAEHWDTAEGHVYEIHIAEEHIFISYTKDGEKRQRVIPITNVLYYDYPPETAEPEYTCLERHSP